MPHAHSENMTGFHQAHEEFLDQLSDEEKQQFQVARRIFIRGSVLTLVCATA